jgi:hypothetical protein
VSCTVRGVGLFQTSGALTRHQNERTEGGQPPCQRDRRPQQPPVHELQRVPSDVLATQAGAGSVTFTAAGTFGFVCFSHTSMKGAIRVVAAAPQSVPASSGGLTVATTVLLLAAAAFGLHRLRRRRAVN